MSSSPTERRWSQVDDAADGRLGRRGDDRRVAQAARRLGRGRRDDLRRDHRQGRRRDPVAGQRPAGADPRRRPARRSPWATPIAEIDAGGEAGRGAPGRAPDGSRASGQRRRAASPAEPAPTAADGEPDRSGFYSPVVRRIADKHGVDLDQVEGTGIGGRVRKKDVLAYVESGRAASRRRRAGRSTPSPRTSPSPTPSRDRASRGHAATRHRDGRASAPGGASRCRRCARRSPSTWSRAAARPRTARRSSRSTSRGSRRGGAELGSRWRAAACNLTYLAFVARATVEALAEHPVLNASVDGDEIVYHDDVNLGIAVALDDGLIVPVIRRAQRLSLEGLAAAIADLAERARAKRLEPDEVHGGTFTITNPGQFGAVLATPIINQPQVAILDLEAIVKRPVVVERAGRRLDRDPADDLSAACRGTTGRSTAPRRRGSSARSRSRLEGWEVESMSVARSAGPRTPARPAATEPTPRRRGPHPIPPVHFDHEELVVRRDGAAAST